MGKLLIVTGMSGAGKTIALKSLEDLGYYCVDNLPIPLVDKFAELITDGNEQITKAALGIDVRSGKDNQLWKILKEMGIPDHLTCLLRNLCAGQEATVRTGHGTTSWFQIYCHPVYLTSMQSTL